MTPDAESRVLRLVAAARRIADPRDALGEEARRVLLSSTGLSSEGVELGLSECLETNPSAAEVAALCASVAPVPRAHVVLSANVFVAAHRAIALALAASPEVVVRASRREPEMAELLHRGAPGLFRLAPHLEPSPGDAVWAYGADETLAALLRDLPEDVAFHAHGAGIGVVVVELPESSSTVPFAEAVARDVVPFDQRGCASPRLVLVLSSRASTARFGEELARALADAERNVPRGRMELHELADVARYRDTARFRGDDLIAAGQGWVGVDLSGDTLLVPPVGRNVHVTRVADALRALEPLAGLVTSAGVAGSAELGARIEEALRGARIAALGSMQRPPFDGPVDRRAPPRVH